MVLSELKIVAQRSKWLIWSVLSVLGSNSLVSISVAQSFPEELISEKNIVSLLLNDSPERVYSLRRNFIVTYPTPNCRRYYISDSSFTEICIHRSKKQILNFGKNYVEWIEEVQGDGLNIRLIRRGVDVEPLSDKALFEFRFPNIDSGETELDYYELSWFSADIFLTWEKNSDTAQTLSLKRLSWYNSMSPYFLQMDQRSLEEGELERTYTYKTSETGSFQQVRVEARSVPGSDVTDLKYFIQGFEGPVPLLWITSSLSYLKELITKSLE